MDFHNPLEYVVLKKYFILPSSEVSHVVVAICFLSCYLNGLLPYARRHDITLNKMF